MALFFSESIHAHIRQTLQTIFDKHPNLVSREGDLVCGWSPVDRL